GQPLERVDVLVAGQDIAGFIPRETPPDGAVLVDLGDAALVPGLIDAHCTCGDWTLRPLRRRLPGRRPSGPCGPRRSCGNWWKRASPRSGAWAAPSVRL